MLSLRPSRALLASMIAFRQLGKVNQSSFSAVKKTTVTSFLVPNSSKIILQQLVSVSTSAKNLGWLKKETRKEYYLTAEEMKTAIENDDIYVVDVRETFEVKRGHVPAKRYVNIPLGLIFIALNMNAEDFEKHFGAPKPTKNDKIVTMCVTGVRSTFALQAAQDMGYENSRHYLGGWKEWESTYPMLKN